VNAKTSNVLLVLIGLAAAGWPGTAIADDVWSDPEPAKKPLIYVPDPGWSEKDEAWYPWNAPHDGPSAWRLCRNILKDEARRLGIQLTSDGSRAEAFDGAIVLKGSRGGASGSGVPKGGVPCVALIFQGHQRFGWPMPTKAGAKQYLLASTNDPQWLRTALRLLKAAWQVRNARVCVVTDDAGTADTVHPQTGTAFHPVPRARLDDEVRKVADEQATAVAQQYMRLGRMDGTVEGMMDYVRRRDKVDPTEALDKALAAKAKEDTIPVARFYLGCRNLLAAEKCQALTLVDQAKYGAAPVIAFSGLADEGIAAAFDPDATLMLMMAGCLLERAGFTHGPLAKNGENGFLASYFTCPTRLLGYEHEPPAAFSIGRGANGKDFGIQARWRKGEAITRLQLKGAKVLTARGRVCYTDITEKEGHRTAVAIELEAKPDGPAPDAASAVLVCGEWVNEMSCLARLLDLDFSADRRVLIPR
jgi:hypothetical protein